MYMCIYITPQTSHTVRTLNHHIQCIHTTWCRCTHSTLTLTPSALRSSWVRGGKYWSQYWGSVNLRTQNKFWQLLKLTNTGWTRRKRWERTTYAWDWTRDLWLEYKVVYNHPSGELLFNFIVVYSKTLHDFPLKGHIAPLSCHFTLCLKAQW